MGTSGLQLAKGGATVQCECYHGLWRSALAKCGVTILDNNWGVTVNCSSLLLIMLRHDCYLHI